MLWGSVLVVIFDYFLNSYYSGKFVGYSTISQIKDIMPSLCIAIVMAFCLMALTLLEMSPIWMLLVQLCTGAVIVIGLCETFRLPEYIEIKDTVLGVLGRNKK